MITAPRPHFERVNARAFGKPSRFPDIKPLSSAVFESFDSAYAAALDGSDDDLHGAIAVSRLDPCDAWHLPNFSWSLNRALRKTPSREPVANYLGKFYDRLSKVGDVHKAQTELSKLTNLLTVDGRAGRFRLTSSEELIADFAEKLAKMLGKMYARGEWDDMIAEAQAYLRWDHDVLAEKLKKFGEKPLANRLSDAVFIRQRLRVLKQLSTLEATRAAGVVNKAMQPYVADICVSDRQYQRKRNAECLNRTVAVNQDDDTDWFTLGEVADSSVSNPMIRRTELMVRLRGTEECALELGHQPLFLTMTTPSRFHAYGTDGAINPNWLEAGCPLVTDGHEWLNKQFKNIRVQWAQAEIHPYGFRMVEPHHDGTPHWHAVLFVPKAQAKEMLRICRAVMLADSGDEPGAKKRRFTVEWIDPSKGSAVAYCSKYISKNIDGHKVGDDEETGKPADEMAIRVDAWKSGCRIRQFQPIGGPSVTAWRQLRRLREQFDEDSPLMHSLTKAEWIALEELRRAADSADWAAFCKAMGGITVRRKDQNLRVAYDMPGIMDRLTGEMTKKLTRFGDDAARRIEGVMWHQVFIATRFKEWQVKDKAGHMRCVRDYLQNTRTLFDHLMDAETYYAMADEAYEQYQAMIDRTWEEDSLVLDLTAEYDFDAFAATPLDPFIYEEALLL